MFHKIDPYTFEVIEYHLEGTRAMGQQYTSPDFIIAKAIAAAALHAEGVSNRHHIKADRNERVNQFIVSLRRQISYMADPKPFPTSDLSTLCQKELWLDICLVNPSVPSWNFKFSLPTIQKWVAAAKREMTSTDSTRLVIQNGLQSLEQILNGVDACVEEAKQINEEGDIVANQLCALLS